MTDEHGRLEAAAALLSQSGPEEPWMAGAAQMHQLFLVRYPALDGPGARDAEGSGGTRVQFQRCLGPQAALAVPWRGAPCHPRGAQHPAAP